VRWRRSSYCSSGTCVEVAAGCSAIDPRILVRDSTFGDLSPRLSFPPAAWRAFVDDLRTGQLARP
jgi:hypothetical protein